jgi:hypothetical protein
MSLAEKLPMVGPNHYPWNGVMLEWAWLRNHQWWVQITTHEMVPHWNEPDWGTTNGEPKSLPMKWCHCWNEPGSEATNGGFKSHPWNGATLEWAWLRSGSKSTLWGLTVTSVTKGGTQKLPKTFWDCHRTIHWKALEEHFLMGQLVFRFNSIFGGNIHFLNFAKKNSVLKELHQLEKKPTNVSIVMYLYIKDWQEDMRNWSYCHAALVSCIFTLWWRCNHILIPFKHFQCADVRFMGYFIVSAEMKHKNREQSY